MALHGGRWLAAALVFAGAWPAVAHAAPTTTDQQPTIAQQLQDPDSVFRPKYRWWLPLAATDDAQLRTEIRQVAENGGGGMEAVAFQVTHGPGPNWGVGNANLQTYGWGTPLWAHKTQVMQEAARDYDVALDHTTGPYWPAATPDLDEINDPRTMQQLVFAQQYVAAGTQRSGPLPANNAPALPTVSRTICGTTSPGDTRIPIANDIGGFGVGDEVVVGTERVTITAKGSAGACTTLSAASVAGATNIKTALTDNVNTGETITIGTGATAETVTITARGSQGATGVGLTVTPALANAHAAGEPVVQRAGTGLTVSPALTLPHGYGETVVDTAKSRVVAVLVARCSLPTCSTQTTGSRLLDKATVQDVTSRVDASGNLDWTAPDDGGMWNVIVYRQTSANNQAGIGGQLQATQANGTIYAVDHLATAGAQATIDYWEQKVVTPATLAAIRATGRGDIFEDSLELANNMKWTSTMVQEWKARRGYDPTLLLPALGGAGRQGTTAPFYDFTDGVRVRTDYRQMWSDLFIDYHLDPLREWAHSIGLTLRFQPYGDPVDTAEASAHIDAPEGESFGFGNNIERYKTIASGAHFSGEKITSTESHASGGNVWNSTAKGNTGPSNLFAFYRAFAGGITQVVYHGFPYLNTPVDTGPTSLWPGFSFDGPTGFSEAWGPRMPQWEDWGTINDNLGRLQMLLRAGKPRFDVGVYWQQFGNNAGILTSTSPLHQTGYTNEYVSPAFLRDPSAQYEGGELFKAQWGFKAFLLNAQATMPADVAAKLLALAKQGLPVVIVGTPPNATPGAKNEDAAVQASMAELTALANVKSVAALGDVPGALSALGVKPAFTPPTAEATPPIVSLRRQTADADLYLLHNMTNATVERTVTLAGSGRPYRIDTWAGKTVPLAGFSAGSGGVTVPVRLSPNNVTVIAVAKDPAALGGTVARGPAVASTTGGEAVYDARGDVAIRSTTAGTFTATLTDGRTTTAKVESVEAPKALNGWSLTVDGWSQPDSRQAGENKHTVIGPLAVTAGANGALPAWSAIPELTDVSGIGTYTTTVNVASPGAYLDLGNATDTVALTVNGQAVPLDQMDLGRIDVGPYLKVGENTIAVRVASTLLNAVRVGSGTGAQNRARNVTYGLTGPVVLTPYGQAGVFSSVDTPGTVGGTVPATLALTLGTAAAFDPFQAGVEKDYTASTTAVVTSTAGDATLSVSDPGHLTNGAFSLPEPLRVELGKATWAGPVSGDIVPIAFKQLIKRTDPLRTGRYAKTLTFTLSTTTP